jgi:hypothetical protein
MIEINLLPEEMRKRKRAEPKIDMSAIDLGKLPLKKIVVFALLIAAAAQVLLVAFGLLCGLIAGSYKKSYDRIAPQRREAEKLSAGIKKMSKKVSAIDELMVKRFSWAAKLNELSDSITPGIWLTQLDYEEKLTERPKAGQQLSARKSESQAQGATEKVMARSLLISGASQSMGEEGTALIGRFIKSLKSNASFYSDFSDIELGSIKREHLAGQEVMTFKITCIFKGK